jgi:microcystin-dependent protein
MSNPYLGQIEIFAFNYAPKGWALCAGQLLQIDQNKELFNLIGTQFGGDGTKTFALPDLTGRTPIGQGWGPGLSFRGMGDKVGEASHTLTISETPLHQHNLRTAYAPDLGKSTNVPAGNVVLARTTALDPQGAPLSMEIYLPVMVEWPDVQMADTAIGSTGGQPHNNMMPYLTMNACIALQGFPPDPPPSA